MRANVYCGNLLWQSSLTLPAPDAEGHVVSQRGATYPVDYAYDEFGDKISMTTYRNAGGLGFVPAAGDTTRWLRDEATGLVTNKVYADGKGPCYTYTPEGKLAMRIWARGIVTTYSYDANGALTNTVYSDGTPTISLAYNRAGWQIEAHDAAGVTTFLYDDFGGVINETVIGVAGTNTIERFYDDFGRSLGYSLNSVRQSTLAYDPATGRLASMEVPVSDGSSNNSPTPTPNSNFFTWNYLSGSDLKSSLAYPNGLTASWQYDANNQLLQVCNATPTNTISQYDYVYDAAGRRINVSKSGTAFNHDDTIAYGYNEKSELTNAVAAVDAAYRYSYDFDEIGNRESSSERGTNSVYAANSLNQYTAVDDFAPQFDDDGNQTLIKTETGIWSVTYNGENRPILWENVSTNSSALNSSTPPLISMSYDRMGRRVTKNAQRFVYDGYLQIANFELVSANSQIPTQNSQLFVWDPTEPIATRPLVWNRASTVSYYAYDGNKNVSQIVSYDDVVLTRYEYSPFGLLTLTSGFCAYDNAWRYSSECADDDIGVVYFNYRFYDYSGGRWTCRDFIYETGGANIYEFCNNDALLYFDSKGEHPALILFLIGILAYPQIANAPTNEFEANNGYSSAGPLNLIVDYSAAKVLSIGVRCCGILMGYLRFKYWETVAILRVANVAKNSSRKVSAVGAAFDPVEGKIAVEMSGGRLIEKPTPIMEAIAEEIGGYGNKNACKNTIGACVEFKGADTLLKQNSVIGNIRFVPVIRPRTMGVLPPCENCLKMLENFDVGPVNPEWNLNMYWIPGSWLLDLDWDLP